MGLPNGRHVRHRFMNEIWYMADVVHAKAFYLNDSSWNGFPIRTHTYEYQLGF